MLGGRDVPRKLSVRTKQVHTRTQNVVSSGVEAMGLHATHVISLDDPQLGTYVLELLEGSNRWVHRRVESVEFRDHRTITRSVSVDFTLPEDCPILALSGRNPVRLVPLASLKRARLSHFHLWDEAGASMPLLTTLQASRVLSSGLIANAETVVDPQPLRDEVRDDIRTIVAGSPDRIRMTLENFEGAAPGTMRRTLYDSPDQFFALLRTWSRLRVLLVPISAESNARRVLKFRYDELFRFRERRWFFWWLRLTGLPVVFEVPAAETAESYHFEVVAPDGVDVTEAALITASGPTAPSTRDHVGGGVPRIHLRAARIPRRAQAIAQASLRVARRGWLGAAMVCSAVMAGTLAVGANWVHSRTKVDPSVGSQAAALLIILPAIFATLLVRPQEHAMAARLLRLVRPLLVLTSLASYAAAATLIIGPRGAPLRNTWSALAIFAVLAGGIICLNWLFPTIKRRRR